MSEQASAAEQANQADNENGGNQNLGWRAALPDDLKNNEVLSGYSNIGDVSKDFLALKKESEGMIKKPGENASSEEMSAYHKAIGVPESPDEYSITKPDLPEGYEYDQNFESHFRQVMKDVGMPKSAAEQAYSRLMQYGVDTFKKNQESEAKELQDATNSLKKDWGQEFDANSEKSTRAIKFFAGKAGIDADNLLKDADAIPEIKKVFHQVFDAIGDDTIVKGENKSGEKQEQRTASGMPMLKFNYSPSAE